MLKFKITNIKKIILILVLFSKFIYGKDIEVELDADIINVSKSESFNVTLTVKNESPDNYGIEGIEKFNILSTSSSSQTSIVNTKITKSIAYNYTLIPKEKGSFQITGYAKHKNNIYKSNTLTIAVSDNPSYSNNTSADFFIKTEISKKDIYFGEKIILGYDFYTKQNIEGYNFLEDIKFDNFVGIAIPKEKLSVNYVYIDGRKGIKYETAKYILTPANTGKNKIKSYNFQVVAGDFFSRNLKYLATEELEINVKSLPEAKPENFKNIVGALNVESSFSKNEINYGDAVTLRVKLYGECNLDNVDKIMGNNIEGFKIYETQKNFSEEIKSGKYYAEKEFEIIIVPENTGELSFYEIKIPYFDTTDGNYKNAKIRNFNIKVKGDKKQEQYSIMNNDENIEISTLPVNNNMAIDKTGEEYFILKLKKSNIKIAAYIFTFVMSVIFIIFIMSNKKLNINILKKDDVMKKINLAYTDEEYYDIINELFKTNFNISIKAQSKKIIENNLENKEILSDLLKINDYMDSKYTGVYNQKIEMKKETINIYKKIKKEMEYKV